MPYKIYLTNSFDADLKKITSKNPKIKGKIEKTLVLLAEDPDHPSLRLHKVSRGQFSVSVDMKIRIIIGIEGSKIILLAIGSHDEVYR